MSGMASKVEMLVDSALPETEGKLSVALKFNSIDDFTPDNIVAQVEPLRNLLKLREQLSDLRNRTASNDRLKDQLFDIINKEENKGKGDE
jgi:type VI secretion system protein ImpB